MADSDKIRFTCPQCNSVLQVAAAKAGKRIRCPQCKELVPVPASSETEETEEIEQSYLTVKMSKSELGERLKYLAVGLGLTRPIREDHARGVYTYGTDPSYARRLYEVTFRVVAANAPNLSQVGAELHDRLSPQVLGMDLDKGEHEAFLAKVYRVLKTLPLAAPEDQLPDPPGAKGCALLLALSVGGGLLAGFVGAYLGG